MSLDIKIDLRYACSLDSDCLRCTSCRCVLFYCTVDAVNSQMRF